MIDFTLTDAQQELRANAAAFAQAYLKDAPATYSQHTTQRARFESTLPIYRAAVEHGLIRGQVPAQLGGTAQSLVDAAILVEEFFAVEPSAALTILGTGLGLTPFILASNEEQRERLLGPFLEGRGQPIASFVHSEPGGTANWLEKGGKGLGTTARRDGEEWVINGEKLWTTNSAGWDKKGADIQCVVCRLVVPDDQENAAAAAALAANPEDAILILLVTPEVLAANPPTAYTVLGEPELVGFPSASGPHTRFTDLRVPHANLLCPPLGGGDGDGGGRGSSGRQVVEQTFGSSAALVGAMGVGIMRAAFEAALRFAREDTRGGSVPILARQSVADLLIDVKVRIEAARLLTWKALHVVENGPGEWKARLELALEAKIFSSDAAVKSVVDVMKAVGITSYSKDQPFSKLLNDAMVLPLFDGGNIGVRRRQIEQIFQADDYQPWAATYGS